MVIVLIYFLLAAPAALALAEALAPTFGVDSSPFWTWAALATTLVVPALLAKVLLKRWSRDLTFWRRAKRALTAGAVLQLATVVALPLFGHASFQGARARAQNLWSSLSKEQSATSGAGRRSAKERITRGRPPVDRGRHSPATRRQEAGFSFAPGKRVQGWPATPKLSWEREPRVAMARARREQKPILVYVGSKGCPSCKKMERSTWRDKRVIEAARKVVLLAIYRWGQEGGSSEWAVRLGVRAYPQLRWIDGWAQPIGVKVVRTVSSIVASVERATSALPERRQPEALDLPAVLLSAIPDDKREACRSADRSLRWPAWRSLLLEKKLGTTARVALARAEPDALAHVAVLESLRAEKSSPELVKLFAELVASKNDYVRAEAIGALARSGDTSQLSQLHQLLSRINHGRNRSGVTNPNNVRADLIEALGKLASVTSIEPLVETAQKVCGGTNSNCRRICRAAHGIWQGTRSRHVAKIYALMFERGVGKSYPLTQDDLRCALKNLSQMLGQKLEPRGSDAAALARAVAKARRIIGSR